MDAVQLADINEGTGLEFGVVAEKNNLFAGLDILLFYICIISYITEQALFHVNGINGKKCFVDRDASQHFSAK